MERDPISGNLTLAVVGCGTMGRGIAQIAALAGCRVLMLDMRDGAASDAARGLTETLNKLAGRGKISAPEAAKARR